MNLKIAFLALLILPIVSCNKENENEDANVDSIYLEVRKVMTSLYYWKDNVTKVLPSSYEHPNDMMHDMRYEKYDRWSEVYEKEVIENFMSGETYGYGFVLMFDADFAPRVAMVYKNTDAYRAGLRRGHILKKVNGINLSQYEDFSFLYESQLGESIEITYMDENQQSHTVSIVSSVIEADEVLQHKIIEHNGSKVGYLSYESFAEHTTDSLYAVMEGFYEKSIDELIIDLRYNGGGEVDILTEWMAYVVPERYEGLPFFRYKHNNEYSEYLDSVIPIVPNVNTLGLERVFVISSKYTASASEALINCLEPYIEVHQIGTTTHGKPVGMYVLPHDEWYMLPIAFEYTNANDEGGFYNGIEPECEAYDDLTKDWGDPEEACVSEALSFISTGSYTHQFPALRFKTGIDVQVPFSQIGLFSLRKVKEQ